MKIILSIFSFLLVIALTFFVWVYFPQYQIQKIKNQQIHTATQVKKESFISYYKSLNKSEINHLAIGDSVIRGVGANSPTENLVNTFSKELESEINKKVNFQNEGINGITSTKLNELVQNGQFDAEIKNADIVTINVGGNDVLQLASKTGYYKAFQSFSQLQVDFSSNLSEITKRIHQLNPKATIYYLELYNPLSSDSPYYSMADKLLPKWNLKIYEAANESPNSLVIETTKVINKNHLQYLSSDGVHPNTSGYSAISLQMLTQLKNSFINM